MALFIKAILKLTLGSIIFLVILFNLKLHHQSDFKLENDSSYNSDVYKQLQFLKGELRHGAGNRMQGIFPEGYLFINSLYGLSWSEAIRDLKTTSAAYQEGIHELNWAIKEIDSSKGRSIFNETLPLPYGAFYRSWSNYLLAKKLELQPTSSQDSIDVILFKTNCQDIANALKESSIPFLESYNQAIWPADIFPGISSLVIHDQIFQPEYDIVIENWIESVKNHLDDQTGLIPHSVFAESGKTAAGARGSSQSLMLNFLYDIDSSFAKQQFEIYEDLFLSSRFSLPGIREYPKGTEGKGDIDSGPVLLDIGGAASIVGQRTAGKFQKWDTFQGIQNSVETFGFGFSFQGEKKYIFGQLPIADAFIVWSNSIEYRKGQVKSTNNWKWKIQVFSALILLFCSYFIKIIHSA